MDMASMDGGEAAAGSINPLLLASASAGDSADLRVLFQWEDAQDPPLMNCTQEFLVFQERASANKRTEVTTVQGGAIPDEDTTALDAAPAARDIEEGVVADRHTAVPDTHDIDEEGIITDRGNAVPAAHDVEEGDGQQPGSLLARALPLLQGITRGGDTALHVVCSNWRNGLSEKCASTICERDKDLLFVKNHNGDTPLHCAARVGNFSVLRFLIELAGCEGSDRQLTLLRMENKRHETVLHEAVRFEVDGIGGQHNMVNMLLNFDPQLANYPADGISPLYLAILLEKSTIALTLHGMSCGNLSYSGPDGQNALHLAVLRDTEMVKRLLSWNKSLAAQVDNDGNTPLHFASSMHFKSGSSLSIQLLCRPPWCRFVWSPWTWTFDLVFKQNPAALYQADKNGFFAIHVAASVGSHTCVRYFIEECPDSAGLRDAKGRTFFHVAVEKGKLGIVSYVCGDPDLAWVLNMQDTDGNTALHLAIQAGSFSMFCALFGNREVNLNITNNQGETPRDISMSKIPSGLNYVGNSEYKIHYALQSVNANTSALRWDKIEEKYFQENPENDLNEAERLKDSAQTLVVASVLIATMAFSATFALPGGYRADDHTNGGSPTLAGRYIFDAFIMATALAFICSALATTGFIFAGVPMVNLITRGVYTSTAVIFMSSSLTCLSIAFALGVYMVLAPVARSTAVVVCVIIPAILVGKDMEFHLTIVSLARPLRIRKGLFRGILRYELFLMIINIWPFVVIFGWGALARIHHGR